MTVQERTPERLALPLSAEGYAQANEAFRQCWTADRDEVLAFLQARLPAPAEELRVLGVGVGDGAFDVRIIDALRAAFPQTPIEYVAVEPNEAQLQRFAERLDGHAPAGLTLSLHPSRAEDYRPDRPFELIHYIHSLYHMPGEEARLIDEAIAGLAADGRLLIALSAERGGIFQLIGRFWERIDYSFFTGGLFGQEQLRALLDASGARYAAEVYPQVAIDVGACFDPESQLGRHLLNFLLQADMERAPAELRAEALAALDELARHEGGRRLLAHPSGVFVVYPPQGQPAGAAAAEAAPAPTDFNDLAETYSGTKGNLIKQLSEEPSFLAAVGDLAGLDVLDLACGDGHYTRMFKRAGARRVVGVDVAEAMVAQARAAEAAEPLGVEYMVGDVGALDELGSFDVVTAAYLFHYAPSYAALEAMMRSIAAHLRPGGRLVSVGISPALGPAELAPLPQYGAKISASPPLADGDPISVTIDTPFGPITFQCHHWTWPAYARALAAAGLGAPEPQPMIVGDAGLQAHGPDFWRPHLDNPSLAVFVARRQ